MKLEISTSRLLYETLRKQALYVIKLLLYSGMQLQAHVFETRYTGPARDTWKHWAG